MDEKDNAMRILLQIINVKVNTKKQNRKIYSFKLQKGIYEDQSEKLGEASTKGGKKGKIK